MPRRLVGERMDDPSLPAREHAHALAGLARLNTLSGTARAIYRRIAPLAASLGRPVTVLDVATGSGDLPIALMRRASKDGLMLSCTGCDVSRRALRRAQARARRHGVPLRTVRLDALAEPLPTADVVTCALFLHHLTDRQAADLLARMAEAADRLLVVSDLRRGAWCTALAAVVPRLTTTSRVVHVDALRSARAAWTMRELHALIRDNTEIRDDTNAGRWTFRRALARAYADHMAASGPSGSFDCDDRRDRRRTGRLRRGLAPGARRPEDHPH
ncbi:MAG: hypothetical protein KatS3mg103_0889 [Phycisphaerales bacterium]|nr:MAG: hypothetical protein KatS3mg103_0889 [Phycisphaerales bacterium]